MIPNLYTSFYDVFGNKPLKKELTRILKLITDESIRKDLKTSLINYTVRRAAIHTDLSHDFLSEQRIQA